MTFTENLCLLSMFAWHSVHFFYRTKFLRSFEVFAIHPIPSEVLSIPFSSDRQSRQSLHGAKYERNENIYNDMKPERKIKKYKILTELSSSVISLSINLQSLANASNLLNSSWFLAMCFCNVSNSLWIFSNLIRIDNVYFPWII